MITTSPPISSAVPRILCVLALCGFVAGCESPSESQPPDDDQTSTAEQPATDDGDRAEERAQMVETQIAARDVRDEAVLKAMRNVPRHEYVPQDHRPAAYRDTPLPIGHDQTISQPFIVALMTELLDVSGDHRILEIGTGSGYQAAVLAEMGVELYTIEIVCELAERAERDLERTGYGDVSVKCGDGYQGWPEHAPFDRIIVTAAPPEIPEALVEQLAVGGKMVVPVGDRRQQLQVVEKHAEDDVEIHDKIPVRFVPMVPGDGED